MNKDWKVFQTDVLDLIRQYEGYMDHFERIGSLNDNSRPDAFARITRKNKKEIWILDAKNKDKIDEEDSKRMKKYENQIKSNPVNVGLELSEISDHKIRKLYITPRETKTEEENIEFKRLHQFLQKELIYNNTDKIVRDIAKMIERKSLSQSQARLLHESLRPFRKRVEKVHSDLSALEADFIGLNLHTPPFDNLEFNPPVDAVMEHKKRDGIFLIDIPYSPREAEKSCERAEEIEQFIEQKGYYVSIHNFDVNDKFACPPQNFKKQIQETLGIISPDSMLDIFSPKFKVEKKYGNGFIDIKSKQLDFKMRIETKNDVEYKIKAYLTKEALKNMKNRALNTRKEFGKFREGVWEQNLEIKPNLNVVYGDRKADIEEYKQNVKNIFQSSVNPVYSKKIAKLNSK